VKLDDVQNLVERCRWSNSRVLLVPAAQHLSLKPIFSSFASEPMGRLQRQDSRHSGVLGNWRKPCGGALKAGDVQLRQLDDARPDWATPFLSLPSRQDLCSSEPEIVRSQRQKRITCLYCGCPGFQWTNQCPTNSGIFWWSRHQNQDFDNQFVRVGAIAPGHFSRNTPKKHLFIPFLKNYENLKLYSFYMKNKIFRRVLLFLIYTKIDFFYYNI